MRSTTICSRPLSSSSALKYVHAPAFRILPLHCIIYTWSFRLMAFLHPSSGQNQVPEADCGNVPRTQRGRSSQAPNCWCDVSIARLLSLCRATYNQSLCLTRVNLLLLLSIVLLAKQLIALRKAANNGSESSAHHQTLHFFSGFIGDPLGHPNTWAKLTWLLMAPRTRSHASEWGSVMSWCTCRPRQNDTNNRLMF